MLTDTVTIEQFVTDNRITIKSTRVDRNPKVEGSERMDNWKVTLVRAAEPQTSGHVAWDVYDRDGEVIDTVFYDADCDADYVRRGLIGHDGYDSDITVRSEPKFRKLTRPVRMTLTFSKGIGHHGAEPEATEVLDCLASDAAGVENTSGFQDWCSEYGYDSDSRKALKTFKACEHEAARLKTFLGDDLYQQLLWHTERQ